MLGCRGSLGDLGVWDNGQSARENRLSRAGRCEWVKLVINFIPPNPERGYTDPVIYSRKR